LLPGRRLVVPDLPGHGGSSPLPAPSLSAFADVVAGLLDEPAAVFGHSMGGVVALRLAERHPELVRSVVLAAPAGISSASRIGTISIGLAGLVQPGRIAGRRVHRVARSARLKQLVFAPLEVSNAELLSADTVHGFLRATTMHSDVL